MLIHLARPNPVWAHVEVAAKFKYDDHNPIDHRQRVSANFDQRRSLHDAGAAALQRRRLERLT